MKLLPRWFSKETNLFIFCVVGFWTVAILLSLIWNMIENRQTAVDIALVHARTSFNKDVLSRRWNATHGTVYVPITEKNQPNPYLSNMPERDITTTSGKKLTMINPAYMTRQIHELAHLYGKESGHITSLKPIRPENAPDQWETVALTKFENGEKECYTLFEQDGKDYLRFMKPLLTEKACLNCHAQQGYTEGVIRGGISVIVSLPPWNQLESNIALLGGHIILWAVGLLGLIFGGKRVNNAIHLRRLAEKELSEANRNLEIKVAERTLEYERVNEQLQNEVAEKSTVQEKLEFSIKQWRETFDVMSDFVSVHDNELKIVKVNKALADFFGKKPEELIGKYCYELMHNSREPVKSCPHMQAIERHEIVSEEIEEPHIGKNLLITCSPVFNGYGKVIGSVHVARDITSQKSAQQEREKLIRELQVTLEEVKTLRGILPICSYCKKIRNDEGYYEQIEGYIHKRSGVDFSHTICPECMKEHYPKLYKDS